MSADPFDAVNPEALVGQTLDGRYRIDGVLGAGGMGMVFSALQTSIQRGVAIKTLHPQLAMAPSFFERFRREAEMASKLHHPNIITIFDFGRAQDGTCYYVMELLKGESLRQRVKREGPMTLRQAAAVIEQAAHGLAHAHKQNAIHRDIKPHNIMLADVDGNEYVKVLDFGLVKALEQEDSEHLTSTGQVLGTPQYMPPEQAGGEPVDQRSDIYSLTGVFYYVLTGRSPFGANTVRKALQAALTQEVPPVSTWRLGAPVPDAVDRVIKKGLAAEKEDRFQSIDEFVTALQAAVAGVPDQVLDAIPQNGPATGKESGSGASTPSKRTTASRPSSKAVSAVSRPIPKSGSQSSGPSNIVVAPQLAGHDQRTPTQHPPPASKLPLIGAIAVLLVVLGGGGAFFMTQSKPTTPAPGPRVVKQHPTATPGTNPTPDTPEAPSPLKVNLVTKPDDAEVVEGDITIGKTPLAIDWNKGDTRTLTFRKKGYKDLEKTLRPEADGDLEFSLESAAPKGGPGRVKPPKKRGDDIGAFD